MADKTYGEITFAQVAREFVPTTHRQKVLKRTCKLTCEGGSEKGTCPCETPMECQIVADYLKENK